MKKPDEGLPRQPLVTTDKEKYDSGAEYVHSPSQTSLSSAPQRKYDPTLPDYIAAGPNLVGLSARFPFKQAFQLAIARYTHYRHAFIYRIVPTEKGYQLEQVIEMIPGKPVEPELLDCGLES